MQNIPLALHSAALVDHTTPAYTWSTGAWGAITDNAAGDLTHTFGADFGLDSDQCVALFQQNAAAVASALTSFGVAHTSDVAKRVTVIREAAMGAASALTDVNYWMIWLKRQP